ncbi:MAG TPA: WYL domain-containing protein [Chthoniobacterales bacterium]
MEKISGGLAAKHSRPPLVRMIRIHESLQGGRQPNCSQLARELEVSTKTAQRDIEFMRDQLQLPIEYDAAAHGYFYAEAVTQFPTLTVTQGELVALLVAQKAVRQYRGTPFEKPIASAFEKLAAGMKEQTGVSLHELSEAFSFKPASLAAGELRAFETIAQAVVKMREIEFDYQSLTGSQAQPRRIRPYHLGCIADQWYVIGFDTAREALRTFALSRTRAVKATARAFERPADFSIQEFLSGSFAAFQAQKIETVKLRLDAFAARLAAERRWHSSQEITPQTDGFSLLTLKVGLAPDLENWILSWGEHATVLEPEPLVKNIAGKLRVMAEHYGLP